VAAIRAWSGGQHAAALAPAMILRVPDPETFQAVATSPLLRKHFVGSLGSQALVVKPEAAESLRHTLGDRGLYQEKELPLGSLPAVFKPRPLHEQEAGKSLTPRLVPVEDREVEDVPADLEQMALDGKQPISALQPLNGGAWPAGDESGLFRTPRQTLELIEEVFATFPGLALLLSNLPEAERPVPLPRRGPRRPRRHSWDRT
jgi:hypothetical protein